MYLIRKARAVGSLALRAVGAALHRAVRGLARGWQAHRRLMDSNAAYAAAMATSAANLIRQITLERFLVALVSACLAIYVAIRGRGLATGQRIGGFRGEQDEWDDEDEDRGVRLFHTPRWTDR